MDRRARGTTSLVAALAALGLVGLSAAGDPVRPAPHPVRIHLPPHTGKARVDPTLPSGEPSAIPCAQCHDTLKAPANAPAAAKIEKVHRDMRFTHGSLSCYACHDPRNGYRQLRLADGTNVAYEDVMTLCSQCHGPQRKDYDHGAHGGMTGYWDLTRGPRERNACTVCHDPHAPSFPTMMPTFKPRDRFLTRSGDEPGHDDGD